jgi:hypothetical protein
LHSQFLVLEVLFSIKMQVHLSNSDEIVIYFRDTIAPSGQINCQILEPERLLVASRGCKRVDNTIVIQIRRLDAAPRETINRANTLIKFKMVDLPSSII